MVDIIPNLEYVIAHKKGVHAAICDEAKDRERVANGLLQQARATSPHVKFDQEHAHETDTSWQPDPESRVDAFFSLNGTSTTWVKSLEYGHMPSGVFGPGGKLGHIDSKPPEGLYILHRAAGLL